ncbi:putative bifunctional diguanylate cyclase/phosphodiesterase [Paenibacillus glufosinatiresistens]|uniref:putative bifunctional diguanylate cyclase/phosphodiesterase n=1 Tax=Paenibacillus glufosinatiresistens TaxID=3070657 RepID=UPI00286EAC27|nr:bifunctional diguanylate cyclase/phosphodiesterase [Paenibacillus sp. YX.27]
MKSEKRKIVQAMAGGVLLYAIIQTMHSALARNINKEVLLTLLQIGSWCTVAFAFAVFVQGRLLVSRRMTRERTGLSALFFGLFLLDFAYTLSLSGSPNRSVISADAGSWLLPVSRLTATGGLFLLYSRRKAGAVHKEAVPAFVRASAGAAAAIALCLLLAVQEVAWGNGVKLGLHTLALLAAAPAILAILRSDSMEPGSLGAMLPRSLFLLGSGQLFLLRSTGEQDLNLLVGLLLGMAGYAAILVGVFRKLDEEEPKREREEIEAQLNYLVYHDELTGLANRRKLLQRLSYMIGLHQKNEIEGFSALAILNINHFKNINDSLGHQMGDRLLQLVAERLGTSLVLGEELFSMGGDEFALLMMDCPNLNECTDRAQELRRLFDKPLELDAGEYHISLSVGLAIYPGDGETAEQLVQSADTAVHHAKEQGKECTRFTPSMQMKASEKLKMENDLRRALERNEFYLLYQPQVRLETQEIVGMEALLRWNHPKRGLVSPVEFIPVAEESGLIVPIGEWVLQTACLQNKEWQKAGYKPICVSVNLSMRQFLQPNLAGKIGRYLEEIELDPKFVDLEITESMTLDREMAFDQLQRLKALGVGISIDDFGTGYSSLHYLKNMPIDRLKIDRSFVSEVMEDSNNAAIVSTITSMAHHLKLKVTAEGVENEEQMNFLNEQQCHEAQGYLFSRPIPAEEFEASFLQRNLMPLPL